MHSCNYFNARTYLRRQQFHHRNITKRYRFFPGTVATTCGTAGADVWYKFVANSAYPTITLSATGSSLGTTNARIQLFSGTCLGLTSLGCVTGNVFSTASNSSTALTTGTTYLVRIYSNTTSPTGGSAWGFTICITNPPPNDDCANAALLTSGSACTNTAGTANSAGYLAASGATACSGTDRYDVWYKFVAKTTNPTITLSTVGANFLNPRIQVLNGTCAGFSSVGCSSGSTYTPTGLTVGTTYYVRIYSTTAPIPNTGADFNICITDPAAPVNDNCAGATNLGSPGATCSNTLGTLLNATGTAGIPGDCGAAGSPEVWYSFVANSAYPTITLSSIGAQFLAAGVRVQLLSGSCGSFTSLFCVSSTATPTAVNVLSAGSPALIPGNTYYIRVYTNSAVMSGTSWTFNICLTNQGSPSLDYGKSYVNITKGSGGGTIEPGDELEMRTTIAVKGGWVFNPSFAGTIPGNTTYVPGTLRILTNEGKTYKQWTDASDGDPATIAGTAVSFNLGSGATQTIGGILKSTDRPLANGICMIMVSYHVIVNAVAYGNFVSVGGGSFSYSNATGTVTNVNFPAVTAVVYQNYGICTNTIGGNAILSESSGTFGTGNTKDRAASGNVPTNYTYTAFNANAPADYYYAVSNNTSGSTSAANYSINPNDANTAHRVFGVWDIIGDHTGATNPLTGNAPADVNNGQSGGYMVVINASYRTDTAFVDTVKNLCPNTSYEYSAWFRNICRKCGNDSAGVSPAGAGYVPTGPGDSSGVHPNLTFNINGYDYYTTGDMGYTGQWVKKGFTYRTGPGETSMAINIRNNAPGGGGNDWAIDDIGVATCTPNLDLNPSTATVNLCLGNAFTLTAAVKSFFNNYTQYIWEKSVNNGATYTSVGFSGTGVPVYNGTEYVYNANGPSFIGDSSQNNNVYRLRVASTPTNLNDPNCSFAATRTVKIYVANCMYLLNADFVNVSGTIAHNFSTIQWSTVNEISKTTYELEKSTDGIHFTKITTIKANGINGSGNYIFNDPTELQGMGYYRIKLVEDDRAKYSKIILLSPDRLNLAIQNLVNPFANTVRFDLILPASGDVRATIFDNYGRAVKTYVQRQVSKGVTAIAIPDINNLASGLYTLKVEWQQESISKRIIKMDNK